jgi:SAM-dependent methyltransferase
MRSGDSDRLLDDDALEGSAVVANSAMNRERGLVGANSYAHELGFSPIDYLLARTGPAAWLDLCCGRGRALIEAAEVVRQRRRAHITLVGIDLVDHFDPVPGLDGDPELISTSVLEWVPSRRFDLITCVHGLHYVGDKLGLLARVAGWLAADGRFVAQLDMANIRVTDSPASGRRVSRALRSGGFDWEPRGHRITLNGGREVALAFRYLGSDIDTGPNYTGQPAVDSYYATTTT